MPNKCVAFGCKSGYKTHETPSNVTLHRFPLQHEELLKKWISRISRENFQPTTNSRLCSLHFVESDFSETRVDKNMTRKRKRGTKPLNKRTLKPDAIPTVFPNSPKYLSAPQPTRRDENATARSRVNRQNDRLDDLAKRMFANDWDVSW